MQLRKARPIRRPLSAAPLSPTGSSEFPRLWNFIEFDECISSRLLSVANRRRFEGFLLLLSVGVEVLQAFAASGFVEVFGSRAV
ncbi:hypothetical protein DU475_11850 [Rhodopseudomonas sp. WA056]|nr:hypothetical protein [Rhodopseudomonas sp. WA056]